MNPISRVRIEKFLSRQMCSNTLQNKRKMSFILRFSIAFSLKTTHEAERIEKFMLARRDLYGKFDEDFHGWISRLGSDD